MTYPAKIEVTRPLGVPESVRGLYIHYNIQMSRKEQGWATKCPVKFKTTGSTGLDIVEVTMYI